MSLSPEGSGDSQRRYHLPPGRPQAEAVGDWGRRRPSVHTEGVDRAVLLRYPQSCASTPRSELCSYSSLRPVLVRIAEACAPAAPSELCSAMASSPRGLDLLIIFPLPQFMFSTFQYVLQMDAWKFVVTADNLIVLFMARNQVSLSGRKHNNIF